MRKAGMGQRLVAIIIDTIIVGFVAGIAIGIFGNTGGIVGFIVGASYQWYFLTRNKGQTPGKTLMGIRVVKKNGSDIDDVTAVVRYVGYLISGFFLFLGYIWAYFNDDRQGWHDIIAGTIVVKA